MRTLLANIIKRAKKEIITLAGVALLSFAVGCENGSRFEGKSLEEVVSMVDSVSEAQEFINDEIDYADCDVNGSYQRPVTLNGAEVQGFRRTFDRKLGVCRDGAVAIAAMLQDNGFPALVLDVTYNPGHSVFVYQDEQGNWGSAGINASDRRHTVFSSLESLARDVAEGHDYKGYTLYDLSFVDLVNGTNDGLVMKEAFKKIQVNSTGVVDYQLEKTADGYSSKYVLVRPSETVSYHTIYTKDLFEDFTHIVTETSAGVIDSTWQVLQRSYSRLPIDAILTTISNGETTTSQVWTSYTSFNEVLQRNTELRRSGVLEQYQQDDREYTGSSLSAQTVKTSSDGDYVFDFITRIEFGPDGTTMYYDSNADGTWDSITKE